MAVKLSRRKISKYIAGQLLDGKDSKKPVRQLAAFLIDSGRVNESDHIARDIEMELASKGHLVAKVTTAGSFSESLQSFIKKQLLVSEKVAKVELSHQKDESVIGGIRIDMPGKRLDQTVSKKLSLLRANYKR